uniref:Uncharacterized protein n=1 Tax=Arundo donax TaxID=35708 RepID=A0A0A9AEQ0_ARUDO
MSRSHRARPESEATPPDGSRPN